MDGAVRARPGGRSARVREAVLVALFDLLKEGEPTVDRVAQRAGVNKTTIYRRWGDLVGLLADALAWLGDERVPIPDTGSFERDLAELAESLRATITGHAGGRVMTALAASAPRSERAAAAIREFLALRFRLASVIVERAVGRGELASDIDGIAVIEALGAPFYLRLLVTSGPIDVTFSQRAAAAAVAAAKAGVFGDQGALSKG